ncbi:MAG: cytochrome c1 [Lautropia sp.]|nr:MAG: cytochrome c1 [Pseudomonadota bacterium]MBC6960773.1 cytochrome c1 [Lautropia sp.]MCL4703426.1 cytochrome c1 [Burkholderiaceae bacterium]MCZ2415039.1 cytochrome c1 [Burkholderiales bacterium]MDL1908747.1 cytochrome c1 [Betaproteobacteria bacterium PRO1]
MKNLVKTLAGLVTALSIGAAFAAGAGYPLDRFPTEKLTQQPALQNGAKLFVNYCLNCHGAALMRYNRLQDIGLTDDQIRKSLLFTADKVGDPMEVAIRPADAKAWFGALPPDLSVIARARASGAGSGADWLYTYLRAYFRDSTRPQGWNNVVFENVGMPHVFWELQGARGATLEEVREIIDDETGKSAGFTKSVVTFDADGVRTEKSEKLEGTKHHASRHWTLAAPAGGKLSQAEFDDNVADLVAYITWMSDPTAQTRTRLGVWVLLFLGLFTVFAWMLNREYWKDVK